MQPLVARIPRVAAHNPDLCTKTTSGCIHGWVALIGESEYSRSSAALALPLHCLTKGPSATGNGLRVIYFKDTIIHAAHRMTNA